MKMRCIFILLSLNIIYRSILPARGQCTVSKCNDVGMGSQEYPLETQEEHSDNLQIVLEKLFLLMERIGEQRFQKTDEAGEIWFKEHYQDLLNGYQNLSFKLDAFGQTARGADNFAVDTQKLGKDLDAMHKNWSFKLDTINEKIQGIDNSLLLLNNAGQSVKESLRRFDQNLQDMHRNMTNAIDEIQTKLTDTEQSIKERIQSHELSLQNLDRKIDGRMRLLLQQTKNSCQLVDKPASVSPEENLALRRPATQSSTLHNYNASRAVDGNKNTNWASQSCSHTSDSQGGPNWWRVKLDRPYRVGKVIVTNRGDCCANRLDYFIVGVTNSTANPVRGTYPLCGQYPSTVALSATVTLNCDPNICAGRYVIIQQPINGPGDFTLCEVEVYAATAIGSSEENLALSRSVTQSSTYGNNDVTTAVDGYTTTDFASDSSTVSLGENLALRRPATQSSTLHNYNASRAVDGNKNTNWASQTCSHTNDGPRGRNWWRVKLDRPYRIGKVTVTNRGDCCANRLDYFIVGVTNSTANPVRGTYPLCGRYPSTVAAGATVTLNCDPNIGAGQYVIIQQPLNGPGAFTLCEVEVYAATDIVSPEVNLALGRPATQSSTWATQAHGTLGASRAVDGDYSNDQHAAELSCSHTNDSAGGPNWWRVQLDRPYRVQKVTVKNRNECCADRLDYFIVGVTNSTANPVRGTYPLCGQYPSKADLGVTLTVSCDPNIGAGQYVIIQQPINGTGYLTLCEVEVYARNSIVSSEENLALSTSVTQSSTYGNNDVSTAVDGYTTTDFASDSFTVSSEENLALKRPATQSSTYQDARTGVCDASRAVDGNYSNDHNIGPLSCSHTSDGRGGQNWWRVRLDRPYRIGKVTVTNRGDCCANRLDYFIVGVTNSMANPVRGAYPLCGRYPSTVAAGATVTLNCDLNIGAGRYVIIQQPIDGPGSLTLCEVEVYAATANVSSEENLALNRPATQSSTYGDSRTGVCDASKAVDGNYSNDQNIGPLSCSHTSDGRGGPNWWRVQLDRPYRVKKVTVTNRGDCCANRLDYFIVGVTNSTADPVRGTYPLCGQYPSTVAAGATVTLNCDPNIGAGRYVIIQQPINGPGAFTLCEVEVYGGTE